MSKGSPEEAHVAVTLIGLVVTLIGLVVLLAWMSLWYSFGVYGFMAYFLSGTSYMPSNPWLVAFVLGIGFQVVCCVYMTIKKLSPRT